MGAQRGCGVAGGGGAPGRAPVGVAGVHSAPAVPAASALRQSARGLPCHAAHAIERAGCTAEQPFASGLSKCLWVVVSDAKHLKQEAVVIAKRRLAYGSIKVCDGRTANKLRPSLVPAPEACCSLAAEMRARRREGGVSPTRRLCAVSGQPGDVACAGDGGGGVRGCLHQAHSRLRSSAV